MYATKRRRPTAYENFELFARGKIQLLTLLLRRPDDDTSVDIVPNDTQLGLVIRPQFAFVHESLELISRYW
jgi:hypothetical protein